MLDRKIIEEMIGESLSTGGDFAEVFVEDKYNSSLFLIGGHIDSAMTGRDFGVGLRIFNGQNSIYLYTNKSDRDSLLKLASQGSKAIINKRERRIVQSFSDLRFENNHNIDIMPDTVEKAKKIELMKRAYSSAKEYDSIISQVSVNYGDSIQNVLIANSEGLYAEDRRVRTRMGISSVAQRDGEMQTGFFGPGGHIGFEFYSDLDIEGYGREASRVAKTMIEADLCPSGKMPVIIDNGFGGVIFHEACGHGLEASSVAKKLSVFTGKLGEQVASPLVTAIDDGTLPNAWGSLNIDDEGTPTKKNVLIEDGILKGYMVDKLNGLRMGVDPTGSSRRSSYKYAPTSRMTNTYIAAGKSKKEEIIANTEYGLYAKNMGGGSVNTVTGEFNFAVMEGYIVRNGKVEEPVRGATLIGSGLEVLQKIDMVGDNLSHGQGVCGASSGSIPANVGQPTIRVESMTVGGRKGE